MVVPARPGNRATGRFVKFCRTFQKDPPSSAGILFRIRRLGSCGGSVGRVADSDTRGLLFESRQQFFKSYTDCSSDKGEKLPGMTRIWRKFQAKISSNLLQVEERCKKLLIFSNIFCRYRY